MVILYTSLTPHAMAATARLARAARTEVVLRDHNSTIHLRALLGTLSDLRVGSLLLRHLRVPLARMPRLLRRNSTDMFASGTPYESAEALADASAMTRRSLDRWVARCGLTSTRLLLAAARLSAGAGYLLDTEIPLAQVAALLGYGRARPLDKQCQALLGASANTARLKLSAGDMARLIAEHLLVARDRALTNGGACVEQVASCTRRGVCQSAHDRSPCSAASLADDAGTVAALTPAYEGNFGRIPVQLSRRHVRANDAGVE